MTPSTALHQLIHSLSQAEKHHFRQQAQRQQANEPTFSLSLFDAICLQEVYDEAALKKHMEQLGSASRNFASLKNTLQANILEDMRTFHRAKSPHQEVHDLLEEARFLKARNLTAMSLKILQKAKEKAQYYEAFDLQLQIADLECTLKLNADPTLSAENLNRFEVESERSIQALGNYYELKKQLHALQYRERRDQVLRDPAEMEAVREVIRLPLVQQDHDSFLLQYMALRVRAIAAQLLGDPISSYDWRRKIVHLWQLYPYMSEVLPGARFNAITNFLAVCCDTERYHEVPQAIQELQSTESATHLQESFNFSQNISYYGLLYRMNTCDWEGANQCAGELQELLKSNQHRFTQRRLHAVRYNLAHFYFFMENFKLSLNMCRDILNGESSQHGHDVQQFVKLLQAVVHFELGNHEFLDSSLLPQVKRSLQKEEKLYAFEKNLIHTLAQLANPSSQKEHAKHLHALQKELHKLRTDPENHKAPGLQEIQYWIEARIQGKRLREVIPRKA
jgi:hypothetical protein